MMHPRAPATLTPRPKHGGDEQCSSAISILPHHTEMTHRRGGGAVRIANNNTPRRAVPFEAVAISPDDRRAFVASIRQSAGRLSRHHAPRSACDTPSAQRSMSARSATRPVMKVHLGILCNTLTGKDIMAIQNLIAHDVVHVDFFVKQPVGEQLREPVFRHVATPQTHGITQANSRMVRGTLQGPRCPGLTRVGPSVQRNTKLTGDINKDEGETSDEDENRAMNDHPTESKKCSVCSFVATELAAVDGTVTAASKVNHGGPKSRGLRQASSKTGLSDGGGDYVLARIATLAKVEDFIQRLSDPSRTSLASRVDSSEPSGLLRFLRNLVTRYLHQSMDREAREREPVFPSQDLSLRDFLAVVDGCTAGEAVQRFRLPPRSCYAASSGTNASFWEALYVLGDSSLHTQTVTRELFLLTILLAASCSYSDAERGPVASPLSEDIAGVWILCATLIPSEVPADATRPLAASSLFALRDVLSRYSVGGRNNHRVAALSEWCTSVFKDQLQLSAVEAASALLALSQ